MKWGGHSTLPLGSWLFNRLPTNIPISNYVHAQRAAGTVPAIPAKTAYHPQQLFPRYSLKTNITCCRSNSHKNLLTTVGRYSHSQAYLAIPMNIEPLQNIPTTTPGLRLRFSLPSSWQSVWPSFSHVFPNSRHQQPPIPRVLGRRRGRRRPTPNPRIPGQPHQIPISARSLRRFSP